MTIYIGLDVDKKGSVYCCQDESGKVLGAGRLSHSLDAVRELIGSGGHPTHVHRIRGKAVVGATERGGVLKETESAFRTREMTRQERWHWWRDRTLDKLRDGWAEERHKPIDWVRESDL